MIDTVAALHPEATVTLGATDEHRLGLLPVVRRVWAPRGQRPVAAVRRRYEWLSVYGFVRPTTGQSGWCRLPTVSTAAFALALQEFARDEGIGPSKQAVLGRDQAGWHVARDLVLPAGVPLAFLPPASPERQPVERLWALVDEPVANRAFTTRDELAAVLVARCRTRERQRVALKTRPRYHWWPREHRRKRQ